MQFHYTMYVCIPVLCIFVYEHRLYLPQKSSTPHLSVWMRQIFASVENYIKYRRLGLFLVKAHKNVLFLKCNKICFDNQATVKKLNFILSHLDQIHVTSIYLYRNFRDFTNILGHCWSSDYLLLDALS